MGRERHIPNLRRLRGVVGTEEDSEAVVGIRQAYQLVDRPSEFVDSCERNPSG